MRAMLLRARAGIETRPLSLEDIPLPEPGPGEIRLRVSVCGICRTDLHVVEGDLPAARLPVVPGHQVVGRVDSAGAGAARFRPGDRVGVAWLARTCGACGFCRAGRENLCEAPLFTGYHRDGGFAEHATVPEAFAYAVPEVFDDASAAPLLCAGIIGYRALARADLPPGGRLALYGFGSSAHIVIQLALHRGSEVFVCTRGERHRRLAREMGASWAGENPDEMPVAPDSSIIFAPAGELVPKALKALKKGGTVSLAGIHMSDIPRMGYDECLFHEKNLRSVTANTRDDGEALLREAARIPLRPKVRAFPLEAANEALLMLKRDRIEGTGILTVG